MRHGDKINNLGRTAAHRRALLANLAISLIEHKRITTTVAKAKALRRYVEPLVTKAKENTTHSRRIVFGYLQNKDATQELFSNVAAKIGERPGGYVRVIRLGFRRGDGAETAMIEFVDFNEIYNPNAGKVKTTKKTRRGGSGAKKAGTSNLVMEDAVTGQVVGADDMVTKVGTIEPESFHAPETRKEEVVTSPVETIEVEPVAVASPVETIEAEPVVAAADQASTEPEAEEAAPETEETAAPAAEETTEEEKKDEDKAA